LDESVEFIETAARGNRSSIVQKAAVTLQERGVDQALKELTATLDEEGKRNKERARELAEASLFKAELELTKLDYDGAQRAIKQAIDFDCQWWSPHARMGNLLVNRAQWNAAEKELLEAQRFVEKEQDTATVQSAESPRCKTPDRGEEPLRYSECTEARLAAVPRTI
jgi:hypothetical protein